MIKVKICGITNYEDALNAAAYGADALGFMFYSKSPRYADKEIVRDICRSIPPFISTVGVFVNDVPDNINSIAEFCGLDAVQLHGDESPDFCSQITKKVIKAFRVRDRDIIKDIQRYKLDLVLLDSYSEEIYGGSGFTFDWEIAMDIKKSVKIVLSGGLNCDNVLTAARQIRPYAVDVSSGVENSKGKKDNIKVKRFIELAKSSNW